MFFFKKQRLQVFKKGLHQSLFPCEICEIFHNSFLLEQLSANVSVSRGGSAHPYQSNKYLIWLTEQMNTFINNQSYFMKQLLLKKSRNIQQQLCPWWSLVLINSQAKLAEPGVHIVLEYFQFRQSITL